MPTYQYACTECAQQLEAVQSFSDPALTECPACQGRLRKVFNSVGIVFKGSGFYRTDSRAGAEKNGSSETSDGGAKKADSTTSDATSNGGSKSSDSAGSTGSTAGSSSSSSGSGSSGSGSSGSGSSGSGSSGSGSGSARSGKPSAAPAKA